MIKTDALTLLISVIAFTLLFVVLTQLRYKVIKIDNLINLKDKL